jgi:hypothetical protein
MLVLLPELCRMAAVLRLVFGARALNHHELQFASLGMRAAVLGVKLSRMVQSLIQIVTTGSTDPATGLTKLKAPEKLRRAAGRAPRLLVALSPVQDLLLCANHLFVAAIVCLARHGAARTTTA